ncbi:hypothetical protein CRUP_002535 [Coryphaenoides rupestris]|nr:hypothetical protein CRUP_002535 [Coryphaenoides rupestris]
MRRFHGDQLNQHAALRRPCQSACSLRDKKFAVMEDYHKPDQQTVQALRNMAIRLRINSIKATTAAGAGYPTSCCSVAEIMSVLFFHTMKYRPEDPRYINNDRFILSKRLYPAAPTEDSPPVSLRNIRMPSAPSYKTGEKVSTRKAYGTAIAKLGRYNERVVALDGDTNNLTYSEIFKNEHPNRFVECYIAQQNMVSVAMGCAARDRNIVFASTLASFFTRAYDQLRMAAISESNINLCGSHCGVSTGEEGPSQMGLEDMSMFRALPTATIFYPSDGVSTEKAVELAAITKVVYQSKDDQVTMVAAGVTLHEALAAAEHLKKERIYVRVIDPFTIKPLDAKTIIDHTRATRGRIITMEDHYYEGGLGEAVAAAVVNESGFTLQRLAVSHTPRSGKPHELLKVYGIDRDAIVQAVRKMLNNSANAK